MTARSGSPKVRGMLRRLSAAARASRLTSREAELVISIQRQAAGRRWRPSLRQDAVIRRLHDALAAAEVTIIDDANITEAQAKATLRAARPTRKTAADILKLEGIEQ